MSPGLTDTDPESAEFQVELLRQATPARRIELALSLSASVINVALSGIARRQPELDEVGRRLAFVEIHYGAELANELRARFARDAR